MTPSLTSAYAVIPTLNAAGNLKSMLPALAMQGLPADQIMVVDSASTDDTAQLARAFGARVTVIARKDFNHGTTRTLAARMLPEAEFLIYLTQDAIPVSADTFANLITAFSDKRVGMAYGRQLPHKGAGAIEAHARIFNYPSNSAVRTLSNKTRLGIKTIFCSNSFAAYRYTALESVGFFPSPSFFAEDQAVAGRMLLADMALAYVADAQVYHSHNYSVIQDFRRYFDVGVFHARNQWLLRSFGRAEGEGLRFVLSELSYLLKNEPFNMPLAIVRTCAKYAGYKLGQHEARISNSTKAYLSTQPLFWNVNSK